MCEGHLKFFSVQLWNQLFLQEVPVPFIGEWYLERSRYYLYGCVVSRSSVCSELGNICILIHVYTHVCMHIHLFIKIT